MSLVPKIYETTTDEILVSVRPLYVDGRSDPMAARFMFEYFVRIENRGAEPVQLLRRHWFISHGGGRIEEVEGEGVVGKQPSIEPGGAYEYNSTCILETFEGTMEGTYLMRRGNDDYFRVAIPRFTLRAMGN